MKTIVTSNGKRMRRLSRWITVRNNYNPKKSNSLWEYVTDEYGYRPYHEQFDPKNGLFLTYFRYNGRNYALDQFYLLGSMFLPEPPLKYKEHGKTHYIATVYMDGDLFHPMYAEWDEYCEHVRLYIEE